MQHACLHWSIKKFGEIVFQNKELEAHLCVWQELVASNSPFPFFRSLFCSLVRQTPGLTTHMFIWIDLG